jgi:hypothetical protein
LTFLSDDIQSNEDNSYLYKITPSFFAFQ